MDLLRDRRILLASGAALAVALGLGMAGLIMLRDPGSKSPPPASRGGLVVEEGNADPVLDPGRPLRCFVGGQLVGTMTLAECARKNGVATRALDLGVDSTGALAAASDTGPVVQTLTPAQAQVTPLTPPPAAPPAATPVASGAGEPTAPCWKRDADWRRLPSDLSLNACVQALYAGRCVKAGDAAYGRWGLETLRLLPRRVEISSDNRTFRPLIDQGANCAIAMIAG
jgi:hypothetical protein